MVTPSGLGLPGNGIEESYYHQLRQQQPGLAGQTEEAGEQGGCGSGAGDPIAGWELPDSDQHAPGLSPGEAGLTRRMVAAAIREHASTGRGNVPAGLGLWAQRTLGTPAVPWQHVPGRHRPPRPGLGVRPSQMPAENDHIASALSSDLVADPFFGGGTAALVCRALGLRYTGADINPAALPYVISRLLTAGGVSAGGVRGIG